MATQKKIEDLGGAAPDSGAKEPAARKSSSKRAPSRSSAKAESELRDRLAECFDRIANALNNRGDEELAEIIREDADVMSAGLVSLTRPFKVLRMPLLGLVAIIEPVLAFGRIVRVLAGRFAERRAQAQELRTHEAERAAYEAAPTE